MGEASGQARSDNHLLALMVQLKCFNRMGYFLRLDEVPAAGPYDRQPSEGGSGDHRTRTG